MKTKTKSNLIKFGLLIIICFLVSPIISASPKENVVKNNILTQLAQKAKTAPLKNKVITTAPPPADLSQILDVLSQDITKSQTIAVTMKKKFSSTKIKTIKTMRLNFQASPQKGLISKSADDQATPIVWDSQFNGMIKSFLTNIMFFNSVFTTTELSANKDAAMPSVRKLLLKPIKSNGFFGIKKIIASLDTQNHLQSLEIRGQGSTKIYEFSASALKPMPAQPASNSIAKPAIRIH